MNARQLLLALALAGSAPVIAQEVIAKMGSTEIKAADLKRLIAGDSAEAQRSGSLDELDQIVRRELVRQALVAEAKAKGFDKSAEFLQKLERVKEQIMVSAYVNSLSKPPADYPSEAELKAAYDTNKASFTIPKQYQLAQIYIAQPANADAATTQKIQQRVNDTATKAAARNADFAKLAREASEHKESAAKGGELGWLPEPQIVPEIRAALQTLQKGGVSGAIKSATGWHIVKVIDTKEGSERPLNEVRAYLTDALRLRKAQVSEQQYLADLIKKAPITVNQVELAKYAQSK